MAEFNRSGTGTDRPMTDQTDDQYEKGKEQTQQYAEAAREKAGEYGEKAQAMADERKDQAASGMQSAAEMVRERSESGPIPTEMGQKAAGAMEDAASYLRDHNTSDMLHDVEEYARKHPAQALAGAVVAGFLIGRILR